MFHARLGDVLTKEAHELQRFLVVEDEVRSERLDLLLLCSAVYQRRVVAKGNAKANGIICLFGISEEKNVFSLNRFR